MGHHCSGLLDGRGGHRPWSCMSRLGMAREAGRLGGSRSSEDQGRGPEQAPSHQQSGEEQPGQLSFAILQPERQSLPGPGGGGVSTLHGHRVKAPSNHCRPPRSFRERPAKACLHSFIRSLSKYLVSPCHVPGSTLGTGDTAVSKTKPLPKVWGKAAHKINQTAGSWTAMQAVRPISGQHSRARVLAVAPLSTRM